MSAVATRFDQVAQSLVARGWRPFPTYSKSKQPALRGWDGLCNEQWDLDDLADAVRPGGQFSGENYACAIAVPHEQFVLDLDIEDEEQARLASGLADAVLGPTPLVRVGRSPRQARIFRVDGPGLRSRRLHPVETSCGSGCVLTFGLHVTTGMPYSWVRDVSPLDINADDPRIPAVTAPAVEKFLGEVFAIVPRTARGLIALKPGIFKNRPAHARINAGMTLHDELRHRAHIVGFVRAAIEMLARATEGIRNETGYAVVAAAVGRGWSGDKIKTLFREHWNGWGGFSAKQLDIAIERCVDPHVHTGRPALRIQVTRPRAVFNTPPWRR